MRGKRILDHVTALRKVTLLGFSGQKREIMVAVAVSMFLSLVPGMKVMARLFDGEIQFARTALTL